MKATGRWALAQSWKLLTNYTNQKKKCSVKEL